MTSGKAARNEGRAQVKKKLETATGSLIWRFATFHASLIIAVNDSPFFFECFSL